jgi:hypothetical protein
MQDMSVCQPQQYLRQRRYLPGGGCEWSARIYSRLSYCPGESSNYNRQWRHSNSASGRFSSAYEGGVHIDLHATNGSWHRYALTYDFPHNPAAPTRVPAFLRDAMLPEVSRRPQTAGVDTFFYGNFNKEHTAWRTYGHEPRYGTEYFGLRGTLGILAEAHAYHHHQNRSAKLGANMSLGPERGD